MYFCLCPFLFCLQRAIRSILIFSRHENVRTQYDVTHTTPGVSLWVRMCARVSVFCTIPFFHWFSWLDFSSRGLFHGSFYAFQLWMVCSSVPHFTYIFPFLCAFHFYWCQLIYELHLNLLYIMQQQQIAIVWSTIRSRSSSLRVQECTICSIDVSKSFVTRPFLFGTVDKWWSSAWWQSRTHLL